MSESSGAQETGLTLDSGLICLALVAQFFRVPADPAQLRHDLRHVYGTFSSSDILRAAKRLGLKARRTVARFERFEHFALPVIAERRHGTFALLAAVNNDKVLIRNPLAGQNQPIIRLEFDETWNGRLILLTSRVGVSPLLRRFDFSWFIPELVRCRRILGEVLLATLIVQIIALLTQIFFQLVLDKVLVHQGISMLHLLIIGLAAVSIFETCLTTLRSYVVAHTAAKVDVALGIKLDYMLALPISYFEARQTGQSLARARGLKNIRSFLMGSAVTG